MACGDKSKFNKCMPFIIVGAILLLLGVPLMIVGIIGEFQFSDIVGYVGGLSSFFGIIFLFVWYVITIPNLENLKTLFENAEKEKSQRRSFGHNNPAFVADSKMSPIQEASPTQENSQSSTLSHENEKNPKRSKSTDVSGCINPVYVSDSGPSALLVPESAIDENIVFVDGAKKENVITTTESSEKQMNNSNNTVAGENGSSVSAMKAQRTRNEVEAKISSLSGNVVCLAIN